MCALVKSTKLLCAVTQVNELLRSRKEGKFLLGMQTGHWRNSFTDKCFLTPTNKDIIRKIGVTSYKLYLLEMNTLMSCSFIDFAVFYSTFLEVSLSEPSLPHCLDTYRSK